MNLLKDELRQTIKSSRNSLSLDEYRFNCLKIEESLKELVDWKKIRSVHIYEPILNLREVDINNFKYYLKTNFSNLDLYTSRKYENIWEITKIEIDKKEKNTKFDVVIVPMLGFDKSLHRIGYGGGYYDKFLSSQPQAKKIGICFEAGRFENLPVETHDINMDIIVTEQNIYK